MKNWLSNHWLKLLAIVLLVGAFGSFPYVYYQLVNWVVVGASLITMQQALSRNKMVTAWIFIFVAVVFNPIAPFELRADIWHIVDVAAILLFLYSLTVKKAAKQK